MAIALALKYRPTTFDDLSEQSAIRDILENQIATHTIKHGYLFTGPAGTGKTTSARIFAKMINEGKGEPIELDAASNNGVDDIRMICEQAQTKPFDSDYKVFIIDEAHMITTAGWNAFLKTLEEPPTSAIFILATTNPEKIPATILSRVQRYSFQRISQSGIVKRLEFILKLEYKDSTECSWEDEALEYIAKIADGGMREAITLMDKCLSYSNELTVPNVLEALGLADYTTMLKLVDDLHMQQFDNVIYDVSELYNSGADMSQFIKSMFEFVLDLNMWVITKDDKVTKLPSPVINQVKKFTVSKWRTIRSLMPKLLDIENQVKYSKNVKSVFISNLIIFMEDEKSVRAD